MNSLLVTAVSFALASAPVPPRQSPKVAPDYDLLDLQRTADALTKEEGLGRAVVEYGQSPVLLSTSRQGRVLLKASFFPSRMSLDEARAAVCREVAHMKVSAEASRADLIAWPKLSAIKDSTPIAFGSLRVHARIRAIGYAVQFLSRIKGKPLALLTLHEIEAKEIGADLPTLEGLVRGKWEDLLLEVRKVTAGNDRLLQRSSVSNLYRVRAEPNDGGTAFWFRDVRLFQCSGLDGTGVSKLTEDLDQFFDSGPQPLDVKVKGPIIAAGTITVRMGAPEDATAGRRQLIKAMWKWHETATPPPARR